MVPAVPPPLAADSFFDAGSVAVPKTCGVPAKYGRSATEIVEQSTRLDIVFGQYEPMQRTVYVASPYGMVCMVVSDDLKTYYDYNAFALESKPLTETMVNETLGLQQAKLPKQSATAATSPAVPLASHPRREGRNASGGRTRHLPRTYPRKEHQMNRPTWTALTTAALLYGCSSSLPATAPGTTGPPPSSGSTPVTFVVSIPAGAAANARFSHARGSHYMSPSTQSIASNPRRNDVAHRECRCGIESVQEGRRQIAHLCRAATAPSGTQTFVVTAYDGAGGAGNVLAAGNVPATLQPGSTQSVSVSLTGEPKHRALAVVALSARGQASTSRIVSASTPMEIRSSAPTQRRRPSAISIPTARRNSRRRRLPTRPPA